jgi:hypothetical protein
MRDRIVAYSIWIAWGSMPIGFIWTDGIPFGGPILVWTWYVFTFFALWFTIRRSKEARQAQPALRPKPNGDPVSADHSEDTDTKEGTLMEH